MAKKYLEDVDLTLLRYADNEMLSILVKYLTTDSNGKKRLTENLTSTSDFKNAVATGDYNKNWQLIACELQHYGGDTIANTIRGNGVLYKTILKDVCKKLKCTIDTNEETIIIEQTLLAHLFRRYWDKLPKEEKQVFKEEFNIKSNITNEKAILILSDEIHNGGIVTYNISMFLASSIAKSILKSTISTKAIIVALTTRTLPVLTALGGIIFSLLLVPSITSSAFRVTIPAVIQIAAIRQQLNNKEMF